MAAWMAAYLGWPAHGPIERQAALLEPEGLHAAANHAALPAQVRTVCTATTDGCRFRQLACMQMRRKASQLIDLLASSKHDWRMYERECQEALGHMMDHEAADPALVRPWASLVLPHGA